MSAEVRLPRWTEPGSEAPAELQELLRTGRAPLGTPQDIAQLTQGLARLHPGLGLSAAPLTTPPAALGLAALARWGAWAAAGISGAAALWYFTAEPGSAPPISPPPAPHSQPVLAQPTLAQPTLAQPTVEPAAKAVAEPPARAPQAEPLRAPASPHAAPRAPAGSSEAQLLRRAQSLLATNPARALELTAEHQRRHRDGVLAEEREALAIEALRRLGRTQAAQRRAAAFEQRYPHSVHASRLRATAPQPAP
jgi:hypothetical protein